ncbi:class A beta-lactamase [Actinomadura sp. CNU-125]|uniref:class A beta-lactamase n=1 Tax=Actinomadura sp. CNU-125 TaxID=1904961 RepID=UPI000A450703|nr:class A beta-lactamase [Actinomadura sp. CNU-125]
MPDTAADLDLRLVRYFTAVAEHRHFGRAAEALHITQPSLSRQVRGLERQLGARLFDRTPRGTRLTEAGEVFLPSARALLRSAAQAAAQTRAAAEPSRITVGYTNVIVTPAVRELRRRHPDADVRTVHTGWDEPRAVLLDHRVDAVVTRLPFPTDGLHVTVLYDEPRVLVVPLDHRLAGKESITLDDIADEPIPRVPDSDPAWEAFWRVDPRPDGRRRGRPGHRGPRRQVRARRRGRSRRDHRAPAPPRRPSRPHHDPHRGHRPEPRGPRRPRRRPQPPRRRLPQDRPNPPDRPRRVTGFRSSPNTGVGHHRTADDLLLCMTRFLRPRSGVAALTTCALLGGAACATDPATDDPRAVTPVADTAIAPNAELNKKLRELEKAHKTRIGAVGIDLGTGKTVGYRPDERFPFNSMFKVFACSAVLHKARTGSPGLMDKVIRWTPEDMAGLTENSPETTEYTDTGMTPAQLCRAGITKSDGFAGNTLLTQIGGPSGLTKFFRSTGDRVSRLDRPEPYLTEWEPGEVRDTTTPAASARTFTELTTGKTLHPDDRARLVGWLKASLTGAARIRAGLPEDWTVGDKTGTGGAKNHGTAGDIAIVWSPGTNAPMILSVLTNRTTDDTPNDNEAIEHTATALAEALGRL